MYRKPTGASILASYFGTVNGKEGTYVFAATHLTKALAFAFSYHDREVAFNCGIEGSSNEIVLLFGGQEVIDKKRDITVFSFDSDGFDEIPHARQAVSQNTVPFSKTEIVFKTDSIDELMRRGLQIFVLPYPCERYLDGENGNIISEKYLRSEERISDIMAKIMTDLHARWINQELNIGVCPLLHVGIVGRSGLGIPHLFPT